ncbi:response regulator transcription factor [Alkalihalobacillus pseudalcaliphilus]|uniref:response regulator transcription factor n=1 Tax=Alkalihalobacillus pseudalcaliphilus TaxID=79884 RepID=UPI00064E1536|nr:response regulator transcription factor [Alkalihalobacillus pseudalcaliphilus]KMK75216.1 PhoB family transcriptional regulator [Alkalihalobacillus pseudalcaliphilus]
MEGISILVVEDEEKIARVLELELTYEGYEVTKILDGLEAWRMYQSKDWDIILLDVMLPGISGIELLRRIRQQDNVTPVIMLTAKAAVEDKVSGLDLGANDYVTKPFQIEELFARIRAALRLKGKTQKEHPDGWLYLGDLKLNDKTREVYRGDLLVELTKKEFDLLYYLLQNKQQVLTREQIVETVWGYDYMGDTNVVDVYIRYLRKKVESSNAPTMIQTVRGVGYILKVQT